MYRTDDKNAQEEALEFIKKNRNPLTGIITQPSLSASWVKHRYSGKGPRKWHNASDQRQKILYERDRKSVV